MGREQSPDSQMGVGARWSGNQAIGGFLHAVVKKLAHLRMQNESCSQRFLEVAGQFLFRVLVDHRQDSDVRVLPRRASCRKAFWVLAGRRLSLPTMRSTTLSV